MKTQQTEMVFNNDINKTCQVLIQEKMDALGIDYTYSGLAEVTLNGEFSNDQTIALQKQLEPYGIHLIGNKKEYWYRKLRIF